jgi:hypothetical protein
MLMHKGDAQRMRLLEAFQHPPDIILESSRHLSLFQFGSLRANIS